MTIILNDVALLRAKKVFDKRHCRCSQCFEDALKEYLTVISTKTADSNDGQPK